MKTKKVYLGIDVSKAKLHLASPKKFIREFDNTVDGHKKLIESVKATGGNHVILEASGGYEFLIRQALHDADITLTVAQPSCVRFFAKAIKVLAKTDQIDASVIAQFGEATKPEATLPTRKNVRKIKALCVRRQQVVDDRVRENNRLEACADSEMRTDLEDSIQQIITREEALDRMIAELLKTDEEFQKKSCVLMQVKGVGPKTTNTLLAHLPELGSLTRQQITSLAGMAPHAKESGTWKGKSSIYGGRAEVRKAMFLAARTAARWCPVIRDFYTRLTNNGKPYKVAIIACARKMLVRLNTLIKQMNNQKNDPNQPVST